MKIVSTDFRFLGEQDGAPERALKDALRPLLLADPYVERSYLAQVEFVRTEATSVALAIVRPCGESEPLIGKISAAFSKLFSSANHLDVVFVSASQDQDLAAVCKPFYVRHTFPHI